MADTIELEIVTPERLVVKEPRRRNSDSGTQRLSRNSSRPRTAHHRARRRRNLLHQRRRLHPPLRSLGLCRGSWRQGHHPRRDRRTRRRHRRASRRSCPRTCSAAHRSRPTTPPPTRTPPPPWLAPKPASRSPKSSSSHSIRSETQAPEQSGAFFLRAVPFDLVQSQS